jgi:chemotaxis protein CheZ
MNEVQAGNENASIGNGINPKDILNKIEVFTDEVGHTFKELIGSLERLQTDIKQLDQLKDLVEAAEQMLSGQHKAQVDMEAKGEVGRLVTAINKTMDNLQQLDKTVHQETGKVPELAQHLDQITLETETATQQVLEKLDLMIEASEAQNNSLTTIQDLSKERLAMDAEARTNIEGFMQRLSEDGDHQLILQEAMEFVALMGEQARVHEMKSEQVNQSVSQANEKAVTLMNHAFDIMNLLQFQDITRQKVSKVISLLKEMQSGLYRLLEIFNIAASKDDEIQLTGKHATQDRILERNAIEKDQMLTEVESIIRDHQNK